MVIFHTYVNVYQKVTLIGNVQIESQWKWTDGYDWNLIGNVQNESLVGGIPTPLKNMSSSVGMIIPNIWKNKKKMFQTTNQIIANGF